MSEPLKILICSDGHAQADNAVRFVAPIALAAGSSVTLLGIAERPGDQAPLAEALLREQEILRVRGVEAEVVMKPGDPIREIASRTDAIAHDIVVIGAEPKAAGGASLRSAKAYEFIRSIADALLIVVGDPGELRRILLCSGGQDHIDRAVALVARIAGPLKACVTLAHVVPAAPMMYSGLIQSENDAGQILAGKTSLGRHLMRECSALAQAGVEADVRVLRGLVAEELLREIDAGNYDLIVVGKSHATGPLGSYIMGDITREIVNRAPCPMLVVAGGAPPRGFLRPLFDRIASIFRSPRAKPPGA